jgi:1-acyl-sn-glycerol-3-phosphate acyltransferase
LEKPTSEDRKKIVKSNQIILGIMQFAMGIIANDFNATNDSRVLEIYRKYLGSGYKPAEDYTTIISNHISWVEIIYFTRRFSPSFIAKKTVSKAPIISYVGKVLNAIYIDRSDKTNRHDTV